MLCVTVISKPDASAVLMVVVIWEKTKYDYYIQYYIRQSTLHTLSRNVMTIKNHCVSLPRFVLKLCVCKCILS